MREKLVRILSDTLGLAEGEITEATTAENTPAWDSVAHLNVVMSIEQVFGVEFQPEEFMRMTSLPAMEELLRVHGAGA